MTWGTEAQPQNYVVEMTADRSAGATSLACKRLGGRLLSTTVLRFGVGKTATVATTAEPDATTIAVAVLLADLDSGDKASFATADVAAPKTFEDSVTEDDETGWVFNRDLNGILAQTAYLAGRQSPAGTFVTATAGAIVGATELPVAAVEAEDGIPADTTLYFVSATGTGATKPVQVTVAAAEGETSLVIKPLRVAIVATDRAPWPAQVSAELDAALDAPSLGAVAEEARTTYRGTFVSGSAVPFRLLAQHATAVGASDHCDLDFVFRKSGGAEEVLARIRARRDGTASTASIDLLTATGGVLAVAMTLRHTRRVGVGASPTDWTMHVDGDLDISGDYIGLSLWRTNPAGTLTHTGSASVTGQLRSIAATGAPIVLAANAGLVRHLNASALQGETWSAGGLEDDGSASLTTATPGPTIADSAADETALFCAVGSMALEVDTDDEGATFRATLDGAPRNPEMRLPAIGMKSQLITFALLNLTSADPVLLKGRKSAGTGSTAGAGRLTMHRHGFEA